MRRDDKDKSLFSNSMDPDHSTTKPAQIPSEIEEEQLGSMIQFETMMEQDIESLNSLKDLLFHEQFPSLKSAASLIDSTIDLLISLFGEGEKSLPEKRNNYLNRLSDLARTFYHSSITSYIRMSSEAGNIFKEELNRAYWKGATIKEIIIEDIKTMLEEFKPFFEITEQFRLYRGMLEFAFTSDLNSSVKEIILGVHTKVKAEKMEKFDIIYEMIQDFISVIEKLINLMRNVEETCIDPFFECVSVEYKGGEKIFDVIHNISNPKVRKIRETELAQTCDIISWGLDDKISVDDLLDIGREYMTEIATYNDQLIFILEEISDAFYNN